MTLPSAELLAALGFYNAQKSYMAWKIERLIARTVKLTIAAVLVIVLVLLYPEAPLHLRIAGIALLAITVGLPISGYRKHEEWQNSLPTDATISDAMKEIEATSLGIDEYAALCELLHALEHGQREEIVQHLPSATMFPTFASLQFVDHVRNGLRDGMYAQPPPP